MFSAIFMTFLHNHHVFPSFYKIELSGTRLNNQKFRLLAEKWLSFLKNCWKLRDHLLILNFALNVELFGLKMVSQSAGSPQDCINGTKSWFVQLPPKTWLFDACYGFPLKRLIGFLRELQFWMCKGRNRDEIIVKVIVQMLLFLGFFNLPLTLFPLYFKLSSRSPVYFGIWWRWFSQVSRATA